MGILAREVAMALKPEGSICSIREQIIQDPVSGLTLQFVHKPGSDAPYRLYVFGNLPHGNREILFNADGAEAGAGTALVNACRPNWLREVKG
jgi:hypothetical protein